MKLLYAHFTMLSNEFWGKWGRKRNLIPGGRTRSQRVFSPPCPNFKQFTRTRPGLPRLDRSIRIFTNLQKVLDKHARGVV